MIELEPRLELDFTVVGPGGQPVPGAVLLGRTSLDAERAPRGLLVSERELGTCDGQGRFVAKLVDRDMALRAASPGFASSRPVLATPGKGRFELRLAAEPATLTAR